MGMTMAEKVLAGVSGNDEVKPGEYVTANVDVAFAHEAARGIFRIFIDEGIEKGVEIGIKSWATEDGQEGLKSYLEKRNPVWKNK